MARHEERYGSARASVPMEAQVASGEGKASRDGASKEREASREAEIALSRDDVGLGGSGQENPIGRFGLS